MQKNANTTNKTAKLSTWLFKTPMKFAISSTLLSLVGIFIYMLIAKSLTITWPIFAIFGAFTIICAVWMLRHTPAVQLNHREFVAIDLGISIILIIMPVVLLFAVYFIVIPMISPMPAYQSIISLFIVAFFACIISMYQIGLSIINLQPVYNRTRTLGVPKWKAIFSLPFSLLTIPCYMFGDKKNTPQSVKIDTAWYERFINRVISRDMYIWAAIIITTICAIILAPMASIIILPMLVSYILIYLIWEKTTGREKMRKNIGGAFATTAVILNILFIAMYIIWIATNINTRHKTAQKISAQYAETITITDTQNSAQ